jgi:hypothetical protein
MTVVEDADGAVLEWYQPVQELGNILSYPGSEAQLARLSPRFHALSPLPAERWFTDESGTTESATWSESSGSDVTTGSVSNYRFTTSNSVNSGGTVPNWTLASTTFDTTPYPDTYLIF